MKLVLDTWNGNDINDGTNYNAYIPEGMLATANGQPIYVPRADQFPALAGSNLQPHTYTIIVEMLGDVQDQRDTLKGWFSVTDFNQHSLVALDSDDSDKDWYLAGIPISIREKDDRFLVIVLALDDPIWRTVDSNAATWAITATGQKKTVTVGGNQNAKPIFVITPTAGRTGQYAYKRWVPLHQASTAANPLRDYPWDIAGGLDTDALVTAGKMLASGDDIRVLVNGTERSRWLEGMDTVATKIWINVDLDVPIYLRLAADIAGAGAVTTIQLVPDAAMIQRLAAAANKVVLINDEAFTYTAVDTAGYLLTGVTREGKGTSAEAHTAGDDIFQIQHEIWMVYGNAAAAEPDTDATKEPLLNRATSTNTSWVFSCFRDTDNPRPGAWSGGVSASVGRTSEIYTADEHTLANPATHAGMAMLAWESSNFWKAETSELAWLFHHPCGMTHLQCTGDKYVYATDWPVVAGGQKSLDGVTWAAIFNEAIPGAVQTWTAYNPGNVALGATYPFVRFVLKGTIGGSVDNSAKIQMTAVTLTLDAAKVPSGTIGAEQTNYHLNAKITNNETGEYFIVTYPIALTKPITVNCVTKSVQYQSGVETFSALRLSSIRSGWLDLLPNQDNELQFDDTGSAGLTVVVAWQDRML